MSSTFVDQVIVGLGGAVVGALATFGLTIRLQRSDRLLDAYAAYAGAVEELMQVLASLAFNAEPDWLVIDASVRLRIQTALGKTRGASKRIQILERDRGRFEALMATENAIYDCTVHISTGPSDGEMALAQGARPDPVKLSQIRSAQDALVKRIRRDFSVEIFEDLRRRALEERPPDEAIRERDQWKKQHLGP